MINVRSPIVTVTPAEQRALRTMPYGEYLKTPYWASVRTAIVELHGGSCALCNAEQRLQVHHRTYERRGREWWCDLVAVCDECHERHHAANGPADTETDEAWAETELSRDNAERTAKSEAWLEQQIAYAMRLSLGEQQAWHVASAVCSWLSFGAPVRSDAQMAERLASGGRLTAVEAEAALRKAYRGFVENFIDHHTDYGDHNGSDHRELYGMALARLDDRLDQMAIDILALRRGGHNAEADALTIERDRFFRDMCDLHNRVRNAEARLPKEAA